MDQGILSIRMGDFASAGQIFESILAEEPDNPDACHLLAVTLINTASEPERAFELLQRALGRSPEEPVFINSLGTFYFNTGHLHEAMDAFERAVALKPDYVDALFNLGNVCARLGQREHAAARYQRVVELDPRRADAMNGLGLAYKGLGRLDEAISQFNRALEQDPLSQEYYLNLAGAYQSAREYDAAMMAIQNAIALDPDNPKAYNNLGVLYDAQKDFASAIEAYDKSAQLDPMSVPPRYNRGLAEHHAGRYLDAVASFEEVLQLAGRWAPALINRGNGLYKLGRLDEAASCFREVIEVDPNNMTAHLNLGHTLRRLGKLEDAVGSYDHAVALDPGNASSHFSKSLVLLKLGQFEEGWRHYEWRFESGNRVFYRSPNLKTPEWNGQDLRGKTLMIIGEQGLGDIVHFSRFIPALRQRCGRIIMVMAPELQNLFSSMEGIDEFVDRNSVWTVRGDYHVFLLSLPRILGVTLSTIPAEVPYLHVRKDEISAWRRHRVDGALNVGFVWSGNPSQVDNAERSCPLSAFIELSKMDGLVLHSLQVRISDEERDQLEANAGDVVDHTASLTDFRDTAAYIQALDLVITIDTSVAHVAGALGAPVWTLLWFGHCWRYLTVRSDSPWYPTMRLFRQRSIGNWQDVFADVRRALLSDHPDLLAIGDAQRLTTE